MSHADERLLALCAESPTEAIARLHSSPEGLSHAEAAARLETYGPNALAVRQELSLLAELGRRLRSPLVVLLLVIAVVSAGVGQYASTVMVGIMIGLSVGLETVLDRRSSHAVEALARSVQASATVVRGGVEVDVPIPDVVPGDVVVLQAGSIVPADGRLLAVKDCFVSESSLTGESLPVEKSVGGGPATTPVLQTPNACFFGTSVTSGTGRLLVVNTGVHTVFGRISLQLAARREETTFEQGLRSFTWLMIRLTVVLVAVVLAVVGLSKGDWLAALLFGLSVAVGVTPEMLPMIVTANLARGALDMAAKQVVVKRLPAIQNFGAIDVLCTDKTGTLTQDRSVLTAHVDVEGRPSEEVVRFAAINAAVHTGLRNLLDQAVLDHEPVVASDQVLVDELPFDFERRRLSVVIARDEGHLLICKGAVEEVLACCTHYRDGDRVVALGDALPDRLRLEADDLQARGQRVVAVAYREFSGARAGYATADESDLVMLGYLSFADPPREDAAAALQRLAAAGVEVRVLTGDNEGVTRRICAEVGLPVGELLSGRDLAGLDPATAGAAIERTRVFVKLSPGQKEQVVRALRASGHVVGFLGDGINDAPALAAADVGVSVDSGADVAKESADIVLLEKSLAVLGDGIVEGRRVFANVVKYLRMGASSNVGNMISVVGASLLLPFLPMQPIQILANNLLYDLSQTSLPSDDVDEEQVQRPLRWDVAGIERFMLWFGPLSSLFDYATFAALWWVFGVNSHGLAAPADQARLTALFQTGWFVESLLTQTLVVHVIRTRRIPFLQSRASWPVLLTTLAVVAAGCWLPFSPLAPSLGLVAFPGRYWWWLGAILVAYVTLSHLVKSWYFRRQAMV